MMLLYVYQNKSGQYFDFFDLTWNDKLEDCIAPYTRFNTLDKIYSQLQNATIVYVGTI